MKFTVIKCVQRRAGSFLIMLQNGGSAVSDVEIDIGRRVSVRDGRVVGV